MNGWNEKIEENTLKLGSKSGVYRIMHDDASSYFAYIDRAISITTIILITLTGTISFSIASIEEGVVYKIVTGCVLYVVAVLTGIKDFFNLTKMSEQHKLYSIRFSALYHNIQRQLSLEKKERQNGKDYIGWINSEFDSLLFSNPDIPDKIKEKASKKYGEILDSNDLFTNLTIFNQVKEAEIKIEINENEIDELDKKIDEKKKDNNKTRYEIDRYMNFR